MAPRRIASAGDHQAITVHGSTDLAHRLAEADQAEGVAWRQLDPTRPTHRGVHIGR
jgi:hypothetical protein